MLNWILENQLVRSQLLRAVQSAISSSTLATMRCCLAGAVNGKMGNKYLLYGYCIVGKQFLKQCTKESRASAKATQFEMKAMRMEVAPRANVQIS